jgi:hypothetical protein
MLLKIEALEFRRSVAFEFRRSLSMTLNDKFRYLFYVVKLTLVRLDQEKFFSSLYLSFSFELTD